MLIGLDLQGWITVLAGLLLALITLFSAYDHVDLPGFGAIALDQQVGISLLLASLATLAGDAQLASRRRLRDQRDRAQAEDAATRERSEAAAERVRAARDRARAEDEAAQERDRARSRAQRQDRCALAQLDFQLNPADPAARARLADLIALLREYGELG